MPRERQVSWAGGELSPSLWGRTDIDRYAVGSRTLKNWIVTPHAVAMNRPGTQHIANLDGPARLYAFTISETNSELLVFTNFKVQVFYEESANDGFVHSGSQQSVDPRHRFGEGISRATAYAEAHLATLNFAQVGDTLTIVSPHYAPYQMRRGPSGLWSIAPLTFAVPAFKGLGPRVHVRNGSETDVAGTPTLYSLAGDSSHPAREWTWQVTRIMRDSNGRLYETMPHTVAEQYAETVPSGLVVAGLDDAATGMRAVYPDWPQRLKMRTLPADLVGLTEVVVASRVYRGRDGRFGYIGETKGDIFVDYGEVPDFSNPPPQGDSPFDVYAYDGSGNETLQRTERPTVVTYFENRRFFAATTQRPDTIWGSAVDDHNNNDEVPIPDDADALNFTLNSMKLDKVQALVPHEKLIALTASQEWVIAGTGEGEVITPTGVSAHCISRHGCAAFPPPVAISSAVFFMQAKGSIPRAIFIDREGLRSVDLSVYSRHFFDGYTLVDWSYAEHPHSVQWAVRSDGLLLAFTHAPEQNLGAWTQHELADDGLVTAVACKPEAYEDGVYLVVNRDGAYTLERMAYRILTDIRQSIFLDRAMSFDASKTDAQRIKVGGSFSVIGITLWESQTFGGGTSGLGVYFSDFGDHDAAGRVISIANPAGGDRLLVQIGDWFPSDFGYSARLLDENDMPSNIEDFNDPGNTDFFFLFNSVSGLGHLEGETVTALADGETVTGLVVSAGSVSLGRSAEIVHVGRGFNADVWTLPTAQGKGDPKVVSKVILELEQVRGGSVGMSLDGELTPLRTREVSDSYTLLGAKRVEAEVIISGEWGKEGAVAFRQSEPLPCTLLGITREYKGGGHGG